MGRNCWNVRTGRCWSVHDFIYGLQYFSQSSTSSTSRGSKYASGTTFGHLNRQINKPKLQLHAKYGFNAHRFIINVNVRY